MTARLLLLLVLLVDVLAVGAAIIIYYCCNGADHFGEGRFVTILSGLQLFAVAWFSYKIFHARGGKREQSFWGGPSMVWAIIALGFVFLSSDELFKVHEGLDKLIHYIFSLDESGVTDRIDDALIAIYGLIGLEVLIHYRNELKLYRESWPFFILGFLLLFASVACDTLTNRDDILPVIFDRYQAAFLFELLSHAEDAAKVFAEAFFIGAFYSVLQKAKSMEKGEIIQPSI